MVSLLEVVRPERAVPADWKCMFVLLVRGPLTPRPGCGMRRTCGIPPTGSSCLQSRSLQLVHKIHVDLALFEFIK